MQVYIVCNAKGGVGKTTTVRELLEELAQLGILTLGIDLDEQGDLTARCGYDEDDVPDLPGTTAEVLAGEITAQEAAVNIENLPGVQLLAGYDDLAAIARDLAPTAIRDLAKTWQETWQAVVIDCPPALNALTLAAIVAADVIVSPVAATEESMRQFRRLQRRIAAQVRPQLKPDADIAWVVPTMIDERRSIDRETLEILREDFPGRVTAPIRETVAVKYSFVTGQGVAGYDEQSSAARDYRAAATQILGNS